MSTECILCPTCRSSAALLDKTTWEFKCERCKSTITFRLAKQEKGPE